MWRGLTRARQYRDARQDQDRVNALRDAELQREQREAAWAPEDRERRFRREDRRDAWDEEDRAENRLERTRRRGFEDQDRAEAGVDRTRRRSFEDEHRDWAREDRGWRREDRETDRMDRSRRRAIEDETRDWAREDRGWRREDRETDRMDRSRRRAIEDEAVAYQQEQRQRQAQAEGLPEALREVELWGALTKEGAERYNSTGQHRGVVSATRNEDGSQTWRFADGSEHVVPAEKAAVYGGWGQKGGAKVDPLDVMDMLSATDPETGRYLYRGAQRDYLKRLVPGYAENDPQEDALAIAEQLPQYQRALEKAASGQGALNLAGLSGRERKKLDKLAARLGVPDDLLPYLPHNALPDGALERGDDAAAPDALGAAAARGRRSGGADADTAAAVKAAIAELLGN